MYSMFVCSQFLPAVTSPGINKVGLTIQCSVVGGPNGVSLHNEYTLCRVHTVQSTHCTEYTLYRVHTVQSTHRTEYTPYRVHTVQSTHRTEYTPCSVHTVQSTHRTEYTPYRVHTVQSTHRTEYTLYKVHTVQSTCCIQNNQCTGQASTVLLNGIYSTLQ